MKFFQNIFIVRILIYPYILKYVRSMIPNKWVEDFLRDLLFTKGVIFLLVKQPFDEQLHIKADVILYVAS